MTDFGRRDDETLIPMLRALYDSELSRAQRDIARDVILPRVRPIRDAVAGSTIAISVAVLVATFILIAQHDIRSGSHDPTTMSPASPAEARTPSATGALGSQSPASAHGHTFRVVQGNRTFDVVDRSGLVVSVRSIAPFEFTPHPPKHGTPFAFNPGGTASTEVGVIWSTSQWDGATVTVDRAAEAISITISGRTHFADLTVRGIMLVMAAPIDATKLEVSISKD